MTRNKQCINQHIEDYLNYYCNLAHSPNFAILLKGQWGSGKTWFINKYCKKLEESEQKCLYISLYGITSLSDIDDKFFELLHPVRSSKEMAITGKILKGLLKGTFKIDLDGDDKDDASWNVQIPEINLPKHLKNIDKSILIFDDLERCNVDISSLLGYINHFVENQNMKVVLIANEDELIENNKEKMAKSNNYKFIKEKLIGKTFTVSPDFEGALATFISNIDNSVAKVFLSKNAELIKDLYEQSGYKNLRNLKQIFLDFERIFIGLPEKVTSNPEVLTNILRQLTAFSVEIRRGNLDPKLIGKLEEIQISMYVNRNQSNTTSNQNEDKDLNPVKKILDTYSELNLHTPFPCLTWWQIFFDEGRIDKQKLEQSISSSKYFQNENTPDWIRLWHFSNLSDDDFHKLLSKVNLEYVNKKFLDIGIFRHIFGLFLMFSDAEIYQKSKQEVLEDAKHYIEYFRINDQLESLIESSISSQGTLINDLWGEYLGLGFQGKEFKEFDEFNDYLNKIVESERIEKLPTAAKKLLNTVEKDVLKFHRMICLNNLPSDDQAEQKYYETPILKYIPVDQFLEKILLIDRDNQKYIFWIIADRYKFDNFNEKLLEELDWLKSLQCELLKAASCRKGELSGYWLKILDTHYLRDAIKKLEAKSKKSESE